MLSGHDCCVLYCISQLIYFHSIMLNLRLQEVNVELSITCLFAITPQQQMCSTHWLTPASLWASTWINESQHTSRACWESQCANLLFSPRVTCKGNTLQMVILPLRKNRHLLVGLHRLLLSKAQFVIVIWCFGLKWLLLPHYCLCLFLFIVFSIMSMLTDSFSFFYSSLLLLQLSMHLNYNIWVI